MAEVTRGRLCFADEPSGPLIFVRIMLHDMIAVSHSREGALRCQPSLKRRILPICSSNIVEAPATPAMFTALVA